MDLEALVLVGVDEFFECVLNASLRFVIGVLRSVTHLPGKIKTQFDFFSIPQTQCNNDAPGRVLVEALSQDVADPSKQDLEVKSGAALVGIDNDDEFFFQQRRGMNALSNRVDRP